MPIGVLMTAGAVVLAGSAPASAGAPAAGTTKAASDPHEGKVAAVARATDTESSRQSRKATMKATSKLTSKVKVTSRATAKATRTAKVTKTVKVTRWADTHAEALAWAKSAAKLVAKDRAAAAAKSRAGKLALAKAKATAKSRAKAKAKKDVRKKFGTVVTKRAAAQRGKPYRWGGDGPGSFDCSGLVNYVMKGAGVKKLPRTSAALAKKANRISKSKKKPGDLVFFTTGGRVTHVGIYAGKNKMWHAPGSGRSVKKANIYTSSYKVGRVA